MNPADRLLHVTTANGPWALHDAAASRAVEAAALATHAPHALMALAGLAVARLGLAFAPHAGDVQVWAGPGNNGGDGLVAARHLHAAGKRVSVALLGDASRLPPDAAQALHDAQTAGVAIGEGLPVDSDTSCLSIDALLGLGARRAPEGAIAAAIARINGGSAQVLAVDVPSGLHPDTGTLLGSDAVRATVTLALLTLKPGCHTGLGRDHAGDVWLDRLGVDVTQSSAWLGGAPDRRARLQASHKGSYGDVAVVGGAPGMLGAAWLAARGALAAGAGRVYCSLLDPAASAFDPSRPELMGRDAWWLSPPELLAATTVACGCGGGSRVREVLPPLLAHARRLVLDADALNVIAADTALQTQLRARAGRGLMTLLTPHPLEAARLLQSSASGVQQDRLQAATALATTFAAAVLLKGSGSVIAAPGEVPFINPTGNAVLAGGGTGDVLAGWAAGLWAQDPSAPAARIGTMAAWLHGDAADRWVARGHTGPLRAVDLAECLALQRRVRAFGAGR